MGDDDLYLDHVQLRARGWTRGLVEKFLVRPDRWASVSHWKNYTGKATYFVERVLQTEQLVDFKSAFKASIVRRKLTVKVIDAIRLERERVDQLYREWLKQVTPDDVKLMLVVDEAAAIFEEARARGYRTPHK